MNEMDTFFLVKVVILNRYGQQPVMPSVGYTAAARRLRDAGLLMADGSYPLAYAPTEQGHKAVELFTQHLDKIRKLVS